MMVTLNGYNMARFGGTLLAVDTPLDNQIGEWRISPWLTNSPCGIDPYFNCCTS